MPEAVRSAVLAIVRNAAGDEAIGYVLTHEELDELTRRIEAIEERLEGRT